MSVIRALAGRGTELPARVPTRRGLPSLLRISSRTSDNSDVLSGVTPSLSTCFDPSGLDCLSPFRVQNLVSVYDTGITLYNSCLQAAPLSHIHFLPNHLALDFGLAFPALIHHQTCSSKPSFPVSQSLGEPSLLPRSSSSYRRGDVHEIQELRRERFAALGPVVKLRKHTSDLVRPWSCGCFIVFSNI